MTWLFVTPMAIVTALSMSMDRLQAEEAMNAAAVAAVGNVELEPRARRSQWADWQAAAECRDLVATTPEVFVPMGIAVKKVKRG